MASLLPHPPLPLANKKSWWEVLGKFMEGDVSGAGVGGLNRLSPARCGGVQGVCRCAELVGHYFLFVLQSA